MLRLVSLQAYLREHRADGSGRLPYLADRGKREPLEILRPCTKMPENRNGPPRSGEGRPAALRGSAEPYWVILVTTPAPTVRPPSRIAKRRPSSQAIGVIISMSTVRLSPGITISVPSGSVTTPVTSVVRK